MAFHCAERHTATLLSRVGRDTVLVEKTHQILHF